MDGGLGGSVPPSIPMAMPGRPSDARLSTGGSPERFADEDVMGPPTSRHSARAVSHAEQRTQTLALPAVSRSGTAGDFGSRRDNGPGQKARAKSRALSERPVVTCSSCSMSATIRRMGLA